jgi:DNA-binding HxlR family transcriptional regulator
VASTHLVIMAHKHDCACCGPGADTAAGGPTDEATDGPSMTCYCPIDGVIETVAKKYAMQVVALLGANGPMRYSELEDRLGVTSTSTFADRLDDLREEGLVERRSFDEVPPRVEYSLTPRGRELEERLQPLLEWADGD